MNRQPLPIYEEILLLALDDGVGTTTGAGFFTNAMGGKATKEAVQGVQAAIMVTTVMPSNAAD